MLVNVSNLSEHGIIADRQPHELPINAFSAGQNVRFRSGFVEKFLGHRAVFDPPTVPPYFLLPATTPTAYYWLYAGLNKVYVTDFGSHFNITRQSAGVDVNYAATADKNWTGGVILGTPVINNGIDPPQMWQPVSTSQRLVPLDYITGTSTWASLSYICGALRVYKDFLVALDVTKSSTRYPFMVKWSHPSTGGAPTNWDETNTTKDAGEYSLSQSPGFCLDCAVLRDVNIIYKEDSVWMMQFIGGASVFRFSPMFRTWGALSRRCALEFFTGKHAVFATGDCVIHDGQNVESLLDRKMRRWLFNQLDQTYITRNFVALNPQRSEVLFCFVPTGSTLPTQALVWNFAENSIGVRDLNSIAHMEYGLINWTGVTDTWDSDSGVWDSDPEVWDARAFNLTDPKLLQAAPVATKLLEFDYSNTFSGTAMPVVVERTGLGLPPMNTQQPPDISSMKLLRRIWPRIEGSNGTTVYVSVGWQNSIDGPVTWGPEMPYIIGQTTHLNPVVRGRMFGVRYRSAADQDWRLHGYELDVDKSGNH